MAAAAFKVSLTARNASGGLKTYYLTASDVNAAGMVFSSGGTELSLSSQNVQIVDIVLSAAGTDCSNTSVFIGGTDTGYRILHAANLGTTVNRQVQNAPIFLPAGSPIKFIQNT